MEAWIASISGSTAPPPGRSRMLCRTASSSFCFSASRLAVSRYSRLARTSDCSFSLEACWWRVSSSSFAFAFALAFSSSRRLVASANVSVARWYVSSSRCPRCSRSREASSLSLDVSRWQPVTRSSAAATSLRSAARDRSKSVETVRSCSRIGASLRPISSASRLRAACLAESSCSCSCAACFLDTSVSSLANSTSLADFRRSASSRSATRRE
mmetsp:Transcript_1448/g.4582  ORF Transcript_1448/g.4582 Transcript_1448/m.4582 type:complete len:213 (-) Transcript_1448:2672-3310(-)